MDIDKKDGGKAGTESYAQPLLTKHDALHALTGASGKAVGEKSTDKQLDN
jgi:hypothetical protein